ncbi:MAG TPA: DUF1329 domain-containing protein [Candidatus Limnocylindrales bacterium]|nr:DUF1329 domain-containing protein [Candidatus Limnocylindrales bacterium]
MKKVEKGVRATPAQQQLEPGAQGRRTDRNALLRTARAASALTRAGAGATFAIAAIVLGFGALAAAQEGSGTAPSAAAAGADPNVDVLRKLLGVPEPPPPPAPEAAPSPAPPAADPAAAAPAAPASPSTDSSTASPQPAPAPASAGAPPQAPPVAASSAPSPAPAEAAPAPVAAPAPTPAADAAVKVEAAKEPPVVVAPVEAVPAPAEAASRASEAPVAVEAAKVEAIAKVGEPVMPETPEPLVPAPAATRPAATEAAKPAKDEAAKPVPAKAKSVAPAKVAKPAAPAKPAKKEAPAVAKPPKAKPEPAVASAKKLEQPLPPEEVPVIVAPEDAPTLASIKRDMPLESPPPPPASMLQFKDVKVPAPGSVVSAANMAEYEHLIGPSVQWALGRGARLRIVAPKPMPLEPARAEATQRYHAQVKLSDDKTELLNYVAGIPFPFVTADEADAATKLMHNNASRLIVDDVDIRHFSCETGSLDENTGLQIERAYVNEHFRRLYYVSRFYTEPKPTWKNAGGVRNRELLYPLLEPFDLKGAGFTYNRYLDATRQDDSWLYFPQQKRVRRLSTAQRSEGVFGQDIDLDSYGGFSGNPAWTEWRLLGVKTILASMHGEGFPPDWQPGSANFLFDDVWEPREVYVIEGKSKLPEYAFGKRIIYLDRESWLIPYTEIYDLNGGLWKALIQTARFTKKSFPGSKITYDYEQFFYPAFAMIDMQFSHCTRCQLPSPQYPGEEGWYINVGEREGTTEEVFEVSSFIQTGR